MWNAESLSREQIREFLKSSQTIEFAGSGRDEKYVWVERVLGVQRYTDLGKKAVTAHVRARRRPRNSSVTASSP
jgi:hypothetical protein